MSHQSEKENVKDAVVSLIVTTPPANSVEIANPMLKPRDAMCDWCRTNVADIFCDAMPCCFDCIEKMIDRENALGIAAETMGKGRYKFRDSLPPLWEKH